MCGRFTLKSSPQQVATLFADLPLEFPDFSPRFNIAPTQAVWAVRRVGEEAPAAVQLRWGLVPFWAKELSIGARMINARLDTVDQKPAFRAAFKARRCLVLADGFYEWQAVAGRKQPYYIRQPRGEPFCFAGIWESWRGPEKTAAVETCSILTTSAGPTLLALHDRMPCVVPPCHFSAWLDPDVRTPKTLLAGEGSNPPIAWEYGAVRPVVNNARHDAPDCIEPLDG